MVTFSVAYMLGQVLGYAVIAAWLVIAATLCFRLGRRAFRGLR